ncbi:MAG TPA: hypothetical protein VJ485_03425 [archaeon]|nr:hypothetical protein [archaeon]
MDEGTAGDTEDEGGGGTTVTSCTSDSSCTANQTCNASKKCVAISCPGGQIVDHMCIGGSTGYKINITSYSSALEALSGERVSTKVTVKNTGTSTITAKLEVTINNITANVSPVSYSLDAGESYLFTVNFTVPNSTTIGNFSGTFKAYVSTNTSVSSSKAFTFTVLPEEETKSEINTSYQELSSVLENLSARLAMMNASGRYNQTVLGPLEELLSNANSILDRMKSALESDDYVSAQSLVSQINASVGNIESGIQDASLQITGALGQLPEQLWLWVAVIVIIAFVVGFFAYMFYPSSPRQGYRPESGYVPASKVGFFSKLKGKFKRKKAPPASVSTLATNIAESDNKDEGHYESFHYSEGYKKERSYDYAYSGPKGFFQKLKKLRRRKDKSPQMHIDQFPASAPAAQ